MHPDNTHSDECSRIKFVGSEIFLNVSSNFKTPEQDYSVTGKLV